MERERAGRGAWYEFFPRSEGAVRNPATGTGPPGTSARRPSGFDAVAAMGFDVIYMPPIHPIGEASTARARTTPCWPARRTPGRPGPSAAKDGGHDAIHPDLGSFEDFDAFVAARRSELGLEVALDLALQAAPDHPWAQSHPEWFTTRVDGSIAYAENPPKKYQDIFPLNFDNDPRGLSEEILRIVRLWISHGVKIFRVDNPHTKPVWFWEWLIAKVNKKHPDVVFLAEAFTRPAMMHALGRAGFQQSYSYFTWRNTKEELEEYFTEVSHEIRGVFPAQLLRQHPGHPHRVPAVRWPGRVQDPRRARRHRQPALGRLRRLRAVRTRGPAGRRGVHRQREVRVQGPRLRAAAAESGRSLAPYLTRLNAIRRAHPALGDLQNLTVHRSTDTGHRGVLQAQDPARTARRTPSIVVVNVDPHGTRESTVSLDLAALELDPEDLTHNGALLVDDLLTGESWEWGEYNYVRLDAHVEPAHILQRPEERQ